MKGSLADIGFLMVAAMGFVIVIFVSFVISNYFSDTVKNMTLPTALSPTALAYLNSGTTTYGIFVNAIPVFIIAIGIGAIVAAFFIPTNPIFVPISILMLIFYVFFSVIFTNVIWEFINAPYIVDIANDYPTFVGFIQYLPYVVAIIGALIIIAMYAKAQKEQSGSIGTGDVV